MTAQMATRLTLRTFKHKKRKVSYVTLCCVSPSFSMENITFFHHLKIMIGKNSQKHRRSLN